MGGCIVSLWGTLSAQELQLGLDRQSPRALSINPPTGFLRLDSAPSWALALRGGWDLWKPEPGQALEVTGGFRLPSERQLTYQNSTGASGDVAARLRFETQPMLGALYRFEKPFGWPLVAGLGVEERWERMTLKDGDLASRGTLSRLWARAVLRHRFAADGYGPYAALEIAVPLTATPTPSGVDYLKDLDHLGSSSNPGTSARAHGSTWGLTVALGYRFGRPCPSPRTSVTYGLPESPVLSEASPVQAPVSLVPESLPPVVTVPVPPRTIVLDEASLHFALDRSDLPPQGIELLRTWAFRIKALSQRPRIVVTGHADSTGSPAHNQKLSLARARAVAEVLKAEGLDVEKVEGRGADQPLSDNLSAEGRAKNRRVEIHLDGEGFDVKGRTDSEPVRETENGTPRRPAKP